MARLFAFFVAAALPCAAALSAPVPLAVRVLGDRVNLRARPVPDAEVVGQVMSGDLLVATAPISTQEWVQVQAPPSLDLWIYSELVRDGHIAVNQAQVRGGPGVQFKRVGGLDQGTPVEIRGVAGDWTRIAPPAGCFLWINRAYVAPVVAAAPAETASQVDVAPADVLLDEPGLAAMRTETDGWLSRPPPSATPAVAAAPPAAAASASPVAVADVPPAPPLAAADPARARSTPAPVLPAALRGLPADPLRPQNAPASFTGILTRRATSGVYGVAVYQLVSERGPRRREVLCDIIGLQDQLRPLEGSLVEVSGKIWHLSGETIPILEATRLLTLVTQ